MRRARGKKRRGSGGPRAPQSTNNQVRATTPSDDTLNGVGVGDVFVDLLLPSSPAKKFVGQVEDRDCS